MRIFLSYRRSDVGGHAGRLSDALAQRLGPRNVFQDVTDIPPGHDFVKAIEDALTASDAALAVIGPGWVKATTADGKPRLFEPDDFVRLELATTLQRGIPVAPVLVGGAALPTAAELPEELRPLLRRQAIVLRDATWHQDVDAMLRSLQGDDVSDDGAAAGTKLTARSLAAIGAAVLAILVALVVWKPWAGGEGSESSGDAPEVPGCPDTASGEWTALTPPAAGRARAEDGAFAVGVRGLRWRIAGADRWDVVVDTELENLAFESLEHAPWRYAALIVAQRPYELSCFSTDLRYAILNTVSPAQAGFVVRCQPTGLMQLLLDEGNLRIPVTDATVPSPC